MGQCLPVAKHTSTHQPEPTSQMEDIDLSALEQATDDLMNFNNNINCNKNNINHYLKISCNRVNIEQDDNIQQSKANKSNITFVIDSGAYPHMCNNPSAFSTYTKWPEDHIVKNVTLADNSLAPIEGIGSIKCKIDNHDYTLKGVLYVPNLSSSLFSVKQHCENPGQLVHFDSKMVTIAFPTFTHNLQIKDEITMDIQICKNHPKVNLPKQDEIPSYQINETLKNLI